jgi:hypothetical protein
LRNGYKPFLNFIIGKSIMKKELLRIIPSILILTIVLTGCGSNPTPPTTPTQELFVLPTVSTTPDPCSTEQIEEEVQKVHSHMREFDDASTLASSLPREQVSASIADLQRIRREAEDEKIPGCLTDLKKYQVEHMNSVINTLLAFMRANDVQAIDCVNIESNNEVVICQNIALARQQHDQYVLELARLLGLTIVPATVAPTPSETPTP